jgi:SAM-dependent methyltransferase
MTPGVAAGLRLNLGCGTDIRAGFVNIDRSLQPGVDVRLDLDREPLPFATGSVAEILCFDVLEHVDHIGVLREIHRVLRPEGIARITVPHFTSPDVHGDPTHRRGYAVASFAFFAAGGPRPYYFDFAFARVERLHLHFPRRRALWMNGLVERWVNGSPSRLSLYESSMLRVFPASYLSLTLVR